MAHVRRCSGTSGALPVLADRSGTVIPIACEFIAYLAARGCSPNTVVAYAYDLAHLWRFFDAADLTWDQLALRRAPKLLGYLRSAPSKRRGDLPGPLLTTIDGVAVERPKLSAATVNRALAAVSAFYDWAILCGRFDGPNPIGRVADRSIVMASDRHRPFLAGIAPTPQLRCRRDLAMVRLMLDGGLRPGEVLGLHLTDVTYGRRRVVVRHRSDHPRGARSKSRTERIVDLHEAATLEAVSAYVMSERPSDASSTLVFLVGGRGSRRDEPLSYAALVRLFARACGRADIRAPWVTPHALRHTHATRMWEAGMRELTLQKRLGHASVEATRLYTRVSDAHVVAEYRRALGLDPLEAR